MKGRAVSTAVAGNVFSLTPSPPRSGKSRHLHLGHKKSAVSALVWKTWFRKSHRIHSGREECFLGRAVPAVVWTVAPFPSWSERSHRSAFVWKVAPHPARAQGYFLRRAVFVSVWKIAASPFWFEKMRESVLVWKVRPSPPWYEVSRRIHGGRQECFLGRAVSASFWKVMPSPPWYGMYPPPAQGYFLGRAVFVSVWKIAASPFWFEKMRRLCLGLESQAVCNLV